MDEQRKHAILFAATPLCPRKFLPLTEIGGNRGREIGDSRDVF